MALPMTVRRRSTEDLTVSKNTIGFNDGPSDQKLKFQSLVSGAPRTITLQPHQVITIDVVRSPMSAIISFGSIPFRS
ncbi:hypothetical protein [Bradyrhizobium sp. USDA 4520]